MRTSLIYFLLFTSAAFSQFSLRTENVGGAKDASEQNMFRATLYNKNAPVAVIERKLPYDVPFPSVHLNEATGNFILSYAFDGFVEMYGPNGVKLWEQNFFKEMKPNYERTITVALGNNTAAFLTSDVTMPNAVIRRFTMGGRQEWETTLPHSMGFEIAMSQDERMIVAGSYFVLQDEVRNTATLLNNNGKIIGAADILFRSASFDRTGKLLALASEREVLVYDIAGEKEIARRDRSTEGIISNLLWKDGVVIVQESAVRTTPEYQFYFADPTLIRYSSELKELSRSTLPFERFKRSTLKLESGAILLKCDDRIITVQ